MKAIKQEDRPAHVSCLVDVRNVRMWSKLDQPSSKLAQSH